MALKSLLGGRFVFFFGILFLGASVGCKRQGPAQPESGRQAQERKPIVNEVTRSSSLGGAELCFNAVDDNNSGLIDEGCGVAQGQVQFVIAWPDPKVDVDLYVTDPDGQIAPVDAATDLGLVRSADCPDEKGTCSGQNYENVYLEEDEVPPGRYRLRIRMEHMPEDVDSAAVSLGVRLQSQIKAYAITLFHQGQEVHLEFEMAGEKKKTKVPAP